MTIDQPYSNRELDAKFNTILEMMEQQSEHILEIKAQTQRTNGRVSRLELGMVLAFGLIMGLGLKEFDTVLALIL